MSKPLKQHLIDPEICIRCHACVEACPKDAITFNEDNVVVDVDICDHEMACLGPCPTGAIDNWRLVKRPYSLEEQFGWFELPEQQEVAAGTSGTTNFEALDEAIAALLDEAHKGAGGAAVAPASASKPTVNLYGLKAPLTALVQGNFRLTEAGADNDVRHIILDLGTQKFPVLEGQTLGIIPPGRDAKGRAHAPRLYSVSSPRDGERPNTNNLSLTVKREENGLCSNYICDLARGDEVALTGPFGATFLLPDDPEARLIMVCTGTGSAPFRAFTMRRQRVMPDHMGTMALYFGARTPQSLPYFGPLGKVPQAFLDKHFAFSRLKNRPKTYVQDELRASGAQIAAMLKDDKTYVYLCGLKAMETGVEAAFEDIARAHALNWPELRQRMRTEGRYHVETY